MAFLQLTLTIGRADPEPFEEALLAAGAQSITLLDAGDDPVLEPLPGEMPLWPNVAIRALFTEPIAREAVIASLEARLPQPLPAWTFEEVPDRAWEREWLADFRPMCFGRRLWICPGGQRPPGPLLESEADVRLIELDPGLAFGTGTHATTALCLEWLDGASLAGKQVIDYGCGSGVLAIAALKLGAASVLAVDIDPQALIATRENAERNGVSGRLTVTEPDLEERAQADILLANILAGPLIELAPRFARLVGPGGQIVLSGILHQQVAAVASRYSAWFDIAPATLREDWARLEGSRRAS